MKIYTYENYTGAIRSLAFHSGYAVTGGTNCMRLIVDYSDQTYICINIYIYGYIYIFQVIEQLYIDMHKCVHIYIYMFM